MTPAERASAVAFAYQNCALEAMSPGTRVRRALSEYEYGNSSLADASLLASEEPKHIDNMVVVNTVKLIERGWPHSGDLSELKAIHSGLFEDVFSDAGMVRTSNTLQKARTSQHSTTSPQNANPALFFPANLIETGAMNIATELAEKRNLHSLDRDVFTDELAKIYDELGYLHPFVGGNAITLRIFASRVAHDAGWDLDWGETSRTQYQNAKHSAYSGDTASLELMFSSMLRPANPTRVFLIAGWDQGPAH